MPSLTQGGFVRALRWLALSRALARWYDSVEASAGLSPSQLLAAVVESSGRTFAAATEYWQAQAGLRAAPATAEGGRAHLAADEPQLATDEAGHGAGHGAWHDAGHEGLRPGHEPAGAWPPTAVAAPSGLQCARDAAREIEQRSQPWSLLFSAYASELPTHGRHPAGAESESGAAAADGGAADGNAGGDVPRGVRAEALQQLLLDFALHRAACGAAAVRAASARLGLSEAVPLSLVQLVALLLGTVAGTLVRLLLSSGTADSTLDLPSQLDLPSEEPSRASSCSTRAISSAEIELRRRESRPTAACAGVSSTAPSPSLRMEPCCMCCMKAS